MSLGVRKVCPKYMDKMRKEFQRTNYVHKLRKIQDEITKSLIDGANIKRYYAKIRFQKLEKFHDWEIDKYYYANTVNSKLNLPIEHMWIQIGDINFDEKTICGILCNNPIYSDVKSGSIVVANFKDIEDLN